jgi:perosamine synthetase
VSAPPAPPPAARAAGAPRATFAAGPLRTQPPAYTPVPAAALGAAALAALRPARDERPALLRELCATYAADAGVLCGSGSQALRLAIELSQRAAGSRHVALPAFSCYDVAAAAVAADATISLYDLDPATLGPDLDSLRAALNAGARVVVAAPLYGVPLDWAAIEAAADEHGALLVEDAAQGFGALWRGTPLGALGRVSVLSFGRGKGWTGGGGGALLFRGGWTETGARPGPAPLAGAARAIVGSLAQAVFGRPTLYRLPLAVPGLRLGETVYHEVPEPVGMPRAAAVLLRRSRAAALDEADARRRAAAELIRGLGGAPDVAAIRPPDGAEPGYLRLPVRTGRGMAVFDDPGAAARLGVAPVYPTTLVALAPVRVRMARGGAWPGAEALVRETVTLPTHSRLTAGERKQVLHLLHTARG